MKRFLCIFLALVTVASLFSGCGRSIDNSDYEPTGDALLMENEEVPEVTDAGDSQELTLAYYPDRKMNPLEGSDYTNRVIMSLIYQGLFAVDSKNETYPILASSYKTTPDNRTWTIYLEEDAKFSDGTRVTREDVLASYEKARQSAFYRGRFTHIARIELSSDGGVDFFMDTPYQNLGLLLDIPIVKASEVDSTNPLGTGPYAFEQTLSGAHLQRVMDWWCGDAKLAATDFSISLVEAQSPTQIRDEFEFGELSLACANPQTDSYTDYRCDYELWEIDNGYLMYVGCNVTYSDFFDDGKLRTLLTYAIDRETLVEDNYDGLAYPATLMVSPASPYYYNALASKYAYDDLKFVQDMGSFKIPRDSKNKERTLRLLVNNDDSARLRIARSLAEALTEFGLPTETLEYATNTYNAVLNSKNYDIYVGTTRLSANYDLSEIYKSYGAIGSTGGMANETLLNMTQLALEDEGTYYNLLKMVADDGRVIPIFFGYYAIYAKRGLLSDLTPARDNVFMYTLGKTMEDCKVKG